MINVYIVIEMNFFKNLDSFSQDVLPFVSIYRIVPDIRSIIVNLARYHTTNRLAAHANENGPVTGGCPISSMVTVKIHDQHLYRELNLYHEFRPQTKGMLF